MLLGALTLTNQKDLKQYFESLDNYDYPIIAAKFLNEDDLLRQWVISKLMCTMEVDYSQFEEKFGQGFQKYFKEDIPNLSQFVDEGFIRTFF